MKKYILFCILPLVTIASWAQSPVQDVWSSFRAHPRAFEFVRPHLQKFERLKKETELAVQQLVAQEGITQLNGVPSYENLASVVRSAAVLARWDSIYDRFFINTIHSLVDQFAAAPINPSKLNPSAYREQLAFYLEEEVLRPEDNYASTAFARILGITSARMRVNEQVSQWLATADNELNGDDPSLNQPISEDYYWPLMNSNWDIILRNPEPELVLPRRMTPLFESNDLPEMTARTIDERKDNKAKLKEVLLFIFDNWKDIKDILNWLSDNVTYDCSSVTRAKQKETLEIDFSLSPDVRRKVKYLVFQRGVLFDGKSTQTHIKGVTHLYRKKGIGWGVDRTTPMGVGYCSYQWNSCENIPWMADGSTFVQAPTTRYAKAYQDHKHPVALTVKDSARDFLTFYFYIRDRIYKTIYLLGSGNCMSAPLL